MLGALRTARLQCLHVVRRYLHPFLKSEVPTVAGQIAQEGALQSFIVFADWTNEHALPVEEPVLVHEACGVIRHRGVSLMLARPPVLEVRQEAVVFGWRCVQALHGPGRDPRDEEPAKNSVQCGAGVVGVAEQQRR